MPRPRPELGLLLLACVLAWTAARPEAAAQPAGGATRLRIEVDADQKTTVVGTADSLQTVISDLCAGAGVRLLSYDATDRPFSARYEGLPLAQVLKRLLTSESYMVGLHASGDGAQTRIAWLRVMGDHGSAAGAVVTPQLRDAGRSFRMPPQLLLSAFTSNDPAARDEAIEDIVVRLRENRDETRAFIATDPKVLAEAIASYPNARDVVTRIQQAQTDVAVSGKLALVLKALDKIEGAGP